MSKGSVSNFTTTSSLPGASMESNEGGEITATRFGNFEVLHNDEGGLHLLGGGGFGKTYKARHVYLNQIVALKVINDRFLHDGSAKERFLREAQVVHQLRHPNIAHVIDFGEVKSALYYAMEFCGGGNLENMVSRIGALPLPTMLRCARQLAEALGCAHSNGFIHRDVKPANIMLTGSDDANPQLKLVDFGLVKHLQGGGDATAALTMTGQQFFTIQFASPEQLMEEELDARSDLFALGMTLWFLVKGAPPESGSMASIVAKRLDARPYEALLPTDLPPAYRSLLARLLEKDRSQRFQNTSEFLTALDAAEAAPNVAPGTAATAADEDDPASDTVTEQTPGAEASTSVTAVYDVHENLGTMPLGVLYWATRKSDHEQVAITMVSDALREDPAQRALIESNVARLRTQPHETIARVYGLEEYQEGLALIQEWHQGVSLHSILKTARFLNYADALRVLLPIAQGTDWTTGQGLPGIVLAMDEIYLQPVDPAAFPEPEKLLEIPLKNWPPFRVRLLPYVIREEASQDVGMTLNTEVVSDPTVAFGCLLYHLVAGHAPRAAAKLSKSAYVTIGRLAEDSNRLLATCIVNERDFGGCEGVLQSLNGSEGVGFPSATTHTTSRRSTTTTGGGPIDLTKSRQPTVTGLKTDGAKTRSGVTTNRLDLDKPATETGGRKGDTTGKGAVVQTKRITRTGGPGSVGDAPATGRAPRDMAREAEEARLKQQEEEGARMRAQQEVEARRVQEAEEARIQRLAEEKLLREEQAEQARLAKEQADEARALKQAEEMRLKQQQAEEARLRKQQQTEQARLAREQADQARALKQAEEARIKQQQAEEARLRKQEADEARAQKLAEDKRLKEEQAEQASLAKQEADEARAQKLAEDKRLKEEQAEQASLAKQEADEARAQKLAEEKLLKQQQAEEAKAKKAEPLTQKPAVALTSRLVTHSLDQVAVEPGTGEREQRSGLPPMVWAGAGALTLIAVGVAAFVFIHKPKPPPVVDNPSPTPPVQDVTPTPTATPVVQQPTAAPLPKEFAFLDGFKPRGAIVKLNGVTLKLEAVGGKVLAPLSGAAAGDSVSVEAPGYEPRTFPITPGATEKSQVVLRRQQGQVKLAVEGGRCDYAMAVFKALNGLAGEQSYVQMSKEDLAVNLSNGATQTNLDTGIYQVTLLGPGGTSDSKLQPCLLAPRLSVTDHGTTLQLPPSFAGRYDFRFAFMLDPAMAAIDVERSVVIDPGLDAGHVDDRYPDDARARPAMDTKITDISVDSVGKLRGRIRYSLRPANDNMSYDEQFELSYVDGHFVMICGGWEIAPTDASVAKALQKAMPKYSIHMQQPPPRTVQKK